MSTMDYEDTHENISDAEPDSDHEDADDAQKLLGTWLGELENLKLGLDNVLSGPRTPTSCDKLSIPTPRMDSYRLSLATLEDTQDIELDAILGELCALESSLDPDLLHRGHARSVSTVIQSNITGENIRYSTSGMSVAQEVTPPTSQSGHKRFFTHRRSSSGGTKSKFEIGGDLDCDQVKGHKMELSVRTDSPDNDSAFSDSVSMLSSESSISSGGRTDTGISSQGSSKTNSIALVPSPTQLLDNISRRLRALKVEVEKENSPPIFIKAFSADNSAKSLLVDERMTVGQVCRLLADKNHVPMDPRWSLVEHIPELFMERIYEDHEYVVENLLLWARESPNKLQFFERDEKYDLFINPEEYLLMGSSSERGSDMDDDAKTALLEEFFSSSSVPEVESALYLKSDGKKAWKKHYFVLRASGIYYCPKGKSKLSKDLICLTTFEMNNVYTGFGWKKKYKAPTDFGFAIKHPQIQTKSSKYIKYLCAEDEQTLRQWVMGIRIAKFGPILKENYDNLMRDIVEEDLETLAHARSFSVSSMAKTLAVSSDSSGSSGSPDRQDISLEDVVFSGPHPASLTPEQSEADVLSNRSSESTPTPTPMEWTNPRGSMFRHDSVKSSSSSSGCMSERSSVSTPTAEQVPFEPNDMPLGTLKRKPSMTPKIPLTNTTRSIVKQSDDSLPPSLASDRLSHSNSIGSNSTLSKTLGRRFSLRRSQTEDQIMVNGIMKSLQRKSSEAAAFNPDHLGGFTLPPPPLSVSTSIESLDIALLPPPPPEAFRGSTASLDSLPPPPPPLDLSEEYSWPSTSSLNSLPPPPSPQTTPTKERHPKAKVPASPVRDRPPLFIPPKARNADRRMSEADIQQPLPFLAELKGVSSLSRGSTKPMQRALVDNEMWRNNSNKFGILPSSNPNTMVDRRASAPQVPKTLDIVPNLPLNSVPPPPPPPPPPPTSTIPTKTVKFFERPSPPMRSDDTRLSQNASGLLRRTQTPATLPGHKASPIPCPPDTFLKDLQKVMEKKWKVAQQLSVDLSATPNEILGFRDPCYLPPVSQSQTLGPPPPPPPPHTMRPRSSSQSKQRKSYEDSATPKKRPPPPPPKRSETTQLSNR
ncbi:abnormal cell migration protein 10-like isoform X4 [Argiope bruennichi]|uniref:abnormal cell migration protein 10-like isoform X4 n=1 Tax=Argiope bruennichi TaxID=94029 RepID=UPI0024943FC0|nr:abnormal cell migration protein 10-like isoform X4 [Argiope bruennichi]